MKTKHDFFVDVVIREFLKRKFLVEKELPLPNGKGSVDIFAKKENLKIYSEVKSSPTSIYSKKARNQLMKYQNCFGEENFYFLVSPNAKGDLKVSSLNEINGSLDKLINCFNS